MGKLIVPVILFMLSAAAFFVSFCGFREKGFLFNNAFIFATEAQRRRMNKKPYYRQSAIIFILLGVVFFLNGIDAILKTDRIIYASLAILAVILIYAVASSIKIERDSKNG